MKRSFALLTGAAIVIGWLAIVPDANAHGRYFGRYGYLLRGLVVRQKPDVCSGPTRAAEI